MTKYNHDRVVSDFDNEINLLKKNGFKPIAVTQMYFEDVFVFETEEEAEKAYRQFEDDGKGKPINHIIGFWYGREEFKEYVEKYEKENDGYSKVLIHWL